MASFKAKTGWKRPRKSENKSYHSVSFLPDAKRVGTLWLHFKQNRMEKDVKERK